MENKCVCNSNNRLQTTAKITVPTAGGYTFTFYVKGHKSSYSSFFYTIQVHILMKEIIPYKPQVFGKRLEHLDH